jgi:hypothetical protein
VLVEAAALKRQRGEQADLASLDVMPSWMPRPTRHGVGDSTARPSLVS